jgi:hypothetical protein
VFLFIDESEDTNHFILAAIKVLDKRFLEDIIRDTRQKFVRNKPLKKHQLNDLNEFHEHILNDKYPVIKRFIFEKTICLPPSKNYSCLPEIYAVYAKKPTNFNRDHEYKRLSLELLKICILGSDDIDIAFDNYNNRKFQEYIYSYLRVKLNLSSNIRLSHQDSQQCKPIQVIDCIAGCLCRSLLQNDLENLN